MARKPINDDDDFLIFSSLSTHQDEKFTDTEKAFIKTQYEGTIMPSLNKVIDWWKKNWTCQWFRTRKFSWTTLW